MTIANRLTLLALAPAFFMPAAPAQENPWNGTWVLNEQRSMPGARGQAADDYRFTLGEDGSITWEIPSLHEVVTGHIDGQPMEIHRPSLKVPMTLAVTAEGPRVLVYRVTRNGKPEGEGRMTLVENGTSWVDISGPAGKPEFTGALVYSRK